MAFIAAGLYCSTPRKTAELSATGVKVYAVQVETKGVPGTMKIIGAAPQIDRDLYVSVAIRLRDKLRVPLFFDSETLVITAPDGTVLTGSAIPTSDLPNLTTTFPALASLVTAPLAYNTQVDKGQTIEATLLFHFANQTEANWKARKAATLTVNLYHQKPQVIELPNK